MKDHTASINAISEAINASFIKKHQARELALQISRDATRHSANAIRAIHRGEMDQALVIMDKARVLLEKARDSLKTHPDLYFTGYVQDSSKEYAEARATYAIITNTAMPSPEDIQVEPPAYLNGLGESVGEMRRYVLDSLRRGDMSRCEELMSRMDDIYNVLLTMDFPEAITSGLRRTTDMVRATLERTRGDLTMALRQHRLEQRLASLNRNHSE